MIESYNNGSRNIEQILEDLLQFAGSLSAEQERHVRDWQSTTRSVRFAQGDNYARSFRIGRQ